MEHINIPIQWKESYTKYPHGFTIFEAVSAWAAQVNTMIDKMNLTQDQIDKLFTDTLPENVENVLNAWYADGSLATLINVDLLDPINEKIDDILTLKPSGNDDASKIQALIDSGKKVKLSKGNFIVNSNLVLKSNTIIEGDEGTTITSNCEKLFYIPFGVENLSFEKLKIFNIRPGLTYLFYMDGVNTNYTTSVRDIYMEKIFSKNFTWFAYMKNARKVTMNHINSWDVNGIYYTDKSAECNIDNSFFVSNITSVPVAGSSGIYSVAYENSYPEGLTISNTLFFQFERNLRIKDLYVGLFTNLYLDGSGEGCLNSIFDNNIRCQSIEFSNSWLHTRGLDIGHEVGLSSPQQYRLNLHHLMFNSQKEGTSIYLFPWAHDVNIDHIQLDSDNVGTHIGIFLHNQNSYINIDAIDFRLYQSYIQVKGVGENVSISNIPYNDEVPGLFSFDHAVNVNGHLKNNSQEHQYKGIPNGAAITPTQVITQLNNILLGRGKYLANIVLNNVNLSAGGDFSIGLNTLGSGAVSSASGSGWDSAYLNVSTTDKNIRIVKVFEVTKEGSFDLKLTSVNTPNGLVEGYHSYMEIVKL